MGVNTVTLSDGRELIIDLSKITLREYRHLWDEDITIEDDDRVYAKALGLTYDELLDLTLLDSKLAKLQVLIAARNPLDVPNSQSVSTLPSPAS